VGLKRRGCIGRGACSGAAGEAILAASGCALAEVKGVLPREYTLRQALYGFAKGASPRKRQKEKGGASLEAAAYSATDAAADAAPVSVDSIISAAYDRSAETYDSAQISAAMATAGPRIAWSQLCCGEPNCTCYDDEDEGSEENREYFWAAIRRWRGAAQRGDLGAARGRCGRQANLLDDENGCSKCNPSVDRGE